MPFVHDLPRSGFFARRGFSARLGRGGVIGLLALLMLRPASADVGLPDYADPLFQSPERPSNANAANVGDYALQPISMSTDLSCNDEAMGEPADNVLDYAPPGDFRPALDQHLPDASVEIPLIIRGNRAVMQLGKTVNTVDVRLRDGRLLLVSHNNDFFKSLQSIQSQDRLLIQTSHTVRQYLVTRARLTQTLSHETDAGRESLSLVACYPFQTVGSKPVFYEVRAVPLGGTGKAGSELISF